MRTSNPVSQLTLSKVLQNQKRVVGRTTMSKEVREYSITLNGRCRETLYIRKHKCIEYPGLGFRCKYCGVPHSTLVVQQMPTKIMR